jgi:hypothetical protein
LWDLITKAGKVMQPFLTLSQRLDYAVLQSGVGATADSVINGADFGESLTTRLVSGAALAGGAWGSGVAADQFAGNQDSIFNTALQGAVGCGSASMAGKDCGSGAIGGAVGSIAGSHNIDSGIAKIIGAGAGAVVGGSPDDIYTSANNAESQAGVVQYSTNNVHVAPDLGLVLVDGVIQVANTNSLIIANHLVADVIPLPANYGGVIGQVDAFANGDRQYMKVDVKGISDAELNDIQSGKTKVSWEKEGDDIYIVLSSGDRYIANFETYDYDYVMAHKELFQGEKGLGLNGIMNSPGDAIKNGLTQTKQGSFVIAYDPTHGLVPDVLEVGYNKLFGKDFATTNITQDNTFVAMINQQNPGIIDASHSAGAVRLYLANLANPSAFKDDYLQFSGSPVSEKDITNNFKDNQYKALKVQNNSGDFVGNM